MQLARGLVLRRNRVGDYISISGVAMIRPHAGIDISKAKYRDKNGSRITTRPRPNHWLPLHRYASEHAVDWSPNTASHWYFEEWKPRIPTYGCQCEQHWKELENQYPPDFSSPQAFFEWGWARHDDVSRLHSHRPRLTLEQAYELFWPDYSFGV